MAERTSWAVGSDAERILTVEDARIAWAGLLTPARSGFQPRGNADPGRVFATSPTPNGSVHVEPFTYHLQSTRGAGVYTMTLDAVRDVNILATAPPDPANDRHDLIVAQQSDLFYGDPDSRMRVRHVVGAASGNPQDPPITGSPDLVPLARVTVHANATAITPDDIQDLRPRDRVTVALGGVLPVPDHNALNTVANPYNGLHAYSADTGSLWQRHNDAWRVPFPRGIIGGRAITGLNSLGGAISTIETMPTNMNSGPISLLPNRRHRIHCRYKIQGTVATDTWVMHLRVGLTAGTSGAQIRQDVQTTINPAFGYTYEMFGEYETGAASEIRFFSLTAARVAGSGSIQFIGGDSGTTNLVGVWVEDVGPAGLLTAIAS